MLGYHRNPTKTVELWRNQWVHTGDLGRLDERRNLFFVGREAHWMRRRGENISAHEIESMQVARRLPLRPNLDRPQHAHADKDNAPCRTRRCAV